ncbi:hypothetical protein F2Q69_00047837 [Brassica cretica]|uniref:Uncharacterized protein n=1 Tax=Brassica cretica TaxID=69181 RepID=A0A8S9Q885_BRACR|nr:hypothetical protein F2Q69_00047837 [Brassica cretica]
MIQESLQLATVERITRNITRRPDDWENDYYNTAIAVYTRQHMHTDKYDEDYEEERATEY